LGKKQKQLGGKNGNQEERNPCSPFQNKEARKGIGIWIKSKGREEEKRKKIKGGSQGDEKGWKGREKRGGMGGIR